MPTWGDILKELDATKTPAGAPDTDGVRLKYLKRVYEATGRPVVLYATAFLESRRMDAGLLQISLSDVQGFMEAVASIQGRDLDLILHSPGGYAEATESIVRYLRSRFDHIRVIVPLAAMSAATMLALAADEIVVGKHSQVGPIDPQVVLQTPEGARAAPARAILLQFERAKEDCRDPRNLAAWTPILRGYGPGLLAQCVQQRDLAVALVEEWLATYMFRDDLDAAKHAREVAEWFADYDAFKSHGRRVGVDELARLRLRFSRLEDEQDVQDAVLSVFHATTLTFNRTASVKIIENHLGKRFVQRSEVLAVPVTSAQEPTSGPANRAQRREQQRRR